MWKEKNYIFSIVFTFKWLLSQPFIKITRFKSNSTSFEKNKGHYHFSIIQNDGIHPYATIGSAEGEKVSVQLAKLQGAIETWIVNVEDHCKRSLRFHTKNGLTNSEEHIWEECISD
jgi:hypothetical protein